MPLAISKAVEDAKKNLFTVPKHGQTITHEIVGRFDAARVVLRPASEGTGVIAGGGVRAVLELAGIRDVLAKSLGTTTPINMTRATVNGLQRLVRPEDVAALRGKTIAEVLPVQRPETRRRGGGARPGARRCAPGGRRRRAAGRAGAEPAAEAAVSRGRGAAVSALKITQVRSTVGQSTATRARCARSGSARSAAPPSTRTRRARRACCARSNHLVRVDGKDA